MNTPHWTTRPSTLLAVVAWGCSAFMGRPSLASFFVQFIILPIVLYLLIQLARQEGREDK